MAINNTLRENEQNVATVERDRATASSKYERFGTLWPMGDAKRFTTINLTLNSFRNQSPESKTASSF